MTINIDHVNRNNLLPVLHDLRGCLKTTTLLWMRALGLPVLSGVVVKAWSQAASDSLNDFCSSRGLDEVLLRIDKPNQRWTTRRGGYIVTVHEAAIVAKQLEEEGLISIFLEPASPFDDEYSIAAITSETPGQFVLEIVGPGFDASDILRSDIGAHERLTVEYQSPERTPKIGRVYRVDNAQYRATVETRLAKIGARLQNPAFPREILDSESVVLSELKGLAVKHLVETGKTHLLNNKDFYQPISEARVTEFVDGIVSLITGLADYGIHMGPSSFSGSFLPHRGLVYWDFFPARKQEALQLYRAGVPGSRS